MENLNSYFNSLKEGAESSVDQDENGEIQGNRFTLFKEKENKFYAFPLLPPVDTIIKEALAIHISHEKFSQLMKKHKAKADEMSAQSHRSMESFQTY